jgi:hypothetical protein
VLNSVGMTRQCVQMAHRWLQLNMSRSRWLMSAQHDHHPRCSGGVIANSATRILRTSQAGLRGFHEERSKTSVRTCSLATVAEKL